MAIDQAHGLRAVAANAQRPVRVVAVASGKGGVGKTNVSVNLAVALAEVGRKVMLLDADLGLANIDVLLGLQPRFTLSDVLEGRCGLEDTFLDGPLGITVVPAASGKRRMAELSFGEHAGLIRAFSTMDRELDALVVDTAAGISGSVCNFAEAAQEVIVVVCNEPTSITDAYALIKVLSREHGVSRVQVLANSVRSQHEGHELYEKLNRVSARFLDVTLGYMGAVPFDDWLRRAVQKQQAVLQAFPSSPASAALRGVARRLEKLALPDGPRGHLEFFVERLVANAGGRA
ncbi:MAG: MinD/ParA family protein [Xanthomonadaceae bacterium]|nr:MinD/ParA family protein [Xanthomonadaceae bacterium]